MKIIYLILVLAVAITAVIFALQNSVEIAISFFSLSASGSLSLVLILTLTIGILIGVLILAPSVFKRSIQFSGLKRRMGRLEKEKSKLDEKLIENDECAENLRREKAAVAAADASPSSEDTGEPEPIIETISQKLKKSGLFGKKK